MIHTYPTQQITGFTEFCQVTEVRDHILEHAENPQAG